MGGGRSGDGRRMGGGRSRSGGNRNHDGSRSRRRMGRLVPVGLLLTDLMKTVLLLSNTCLAYSSISCTIVYKGLYSSIPSISSQI
jgi:hypothetical protein